MINDARAARNENRASSLARSFRCAFPSDEMRLGGVRCWYGEPRENPFRKLARESPYDEGEENFLEFLFPLCSRPLGGKKVA